MVKTEIFAPPAAGSSNENKVGCLNERTYEVGLGTNHILRPDPVLEILTTQAILDIPPGIGVWTEMVELKMASSPGTILIEVLFRTYLWRRETKENKTNTVCHDKIQYGFDDAAFKIPELVPA